MDLAYSRSPYFLRSAGSFCSRLSVSWRAFKKGLPPPEFVRFETMCFRTWSTKPQAPRLFKKLRRWWPAELRFRSAWIFRARSIARMGLSPNLIYTIRAEPGLRAQRRIRCAIPSTGPFAPPPAIHALSKRTALLGLNALGERRVVTRPSHLVFRSPSWKLRGFPPRVPLYPTWHLGLWRVPSTLV